MQIALHLVDGPRAAAQSGENGDQHIGVMLDAVQIVVVFVIVMGAFVARQIALKLIFQTAVRRLRCQHIRILGGIGTGGDGRSRALQHHGAGGKDVQHKGQSQTNSTDDQKSLLMLPDKIGGLFRCLPDRFRCLAGGLRRLLRGFRGPSGFGSGILFSDCPPLLPLGNGIAGGLFQFRLFVEGVQVGLFQFAFRCRCLAVGPQALGADRRCGQPRTGFRVALHEVRRLQSHVIVLILPDFPVCRDGRGVDGSGLGSMGQLGGRLLILKGELGRDLAGGRLHGSGFHRLFQDFGLGLVRFRRRLFTFRMGFSSSGVSISSWVNFRRGSRFTARPPGVWWS